MLPARRRARVISCEVISGALIFLNVGGVQDHERGPFCDPKVAG